MEEKSERLFKEIVILSRNIFISVFVFGFIAFLLSMVEINWLASISLAVCFLVIFVSWIAPGVFVIFGKPWLAHAWLRGINPLVYPAKPWDELSLWHKFGVYFSSFLFPGFMLFAVIGILIDNFNK